MKITCLILTLLLSLKLTAQPVSFSRELILMGSRFELTAMAPTDLTARKAVENAIREIRRIEALISEWDSLSQVSEINRRAGIHPVKVDYELFSLIRRSNKVSALSGGAFDISFASSDRIWKFDGSMKNLPTEEQIRNSVARIGYQKIILNETDTTVFLPEKGMRIGFGAIGKGYAANRGKAIMRETGATGGLVNAGGDLICWGDSPSPEGWRVGIANPQSRNDLIAWMAINEMAVVTSGDYERFVILEGKRYAHIINPKTGWPVSGLQSVTILCADAELADALATAVFVMGEKEGMALVNQLKGVECMIINDKNEILKSKDLKINFYEEKPVIEKAPSLIIGQ
ncbi:MAG: FAD:protein FMN transferase [Bacteroidia bacterium]|nr:FAD:protein FMN transferase [Bacteroidia bacterium]